MLTSIYSWRLIFKTFHGDYNNQSIKIDKINESSLVMTIPLIILAIGSIFAGYFFKDLFIGFEKSYQFWNTSIFFLEPLSSEHPPKWFIFLTPILVTVSIPIAYYFFVKRKDLLPVIVDSNKPFYNFLKNKWYFDEIYEFIFVRNISRIGNFLSNFGDKRIIDGLGPDGISLRVMDIAKQISRIQTGYIYHYAFAMLIGLMLFITYFFIRV